MDGRWEEAIQKGISYMIKGISGTASDSTAKLVYFIHPTTLLLLARGLSWVVAYIDAQNGEEIHGAVDYVSHASYQV
ncbi:extracellular metalloproteinase MEP [Penicillium malachiteum]|uniref:extracellular metalloproteinase MEP n=1 Tax=Penicillium malachiteum TaxID=1324776 RepID=UPI002546B54C|nr:extracellular metalloproteinase MEP [Penicillium malachiteum]KAJ5731395.1 extracellular metalloproteinase MEP [Penicillium malachiteum]